MTSESRSAAIDLHATLTELFPHNQFDPKKFPREIVGAIVLYRRELQQLRDDTKTFRKYAAAYAEGANPQLSVGWGHDGLDE